jgi:hypothetical protein
MGFPMVSDEVDSEGKSLVNSATLPEPEVHRGYRRVARLKAKRVPIEASLPGSAPLYFASRNADWT